MSDDLARVIEDVIRKTLVDGPSALRPSREIATAVRSYLLSETVRHRVARALHSLDNNDDLWLPGWFDVEARAALTAAIGEDDRAQP